MICQLFQTSDHLLNPQNTVALCPRPSKVMSNLGTPLFEHQKSPSPSSQNSSLVLGWLKLSIQNSIRHFWKFCPISLALQMTTNKRQAEGHSHWVSLGIMTAVGWSLPCLNSGLLCNIDSPSLLLLGKLISLLLNKSVLLAMASSLSHSGHIANSTDQFSIWQNGVMVERE